MSQTQGERALAQHSGRTYAKGGTLLHRVLWVLIGQPLISSILCPKNLRVGILRAFGATIGSGVLIRHHVRVHWPWRLEIGRDSWVGVGVWILNPEMVRIGHDVCISQEVLLCSGSHDMNDPAFESDNAAITIGDGVWLAIRSTVLKGVTIGEGAVVGATAVVSRSIAPYQRVHAPAVNSPRKPSANVSRANTSTG